MPRDLGDVLHFFMPELSKEPSGEREDARQASAEPPVPPHEAPLPELSVAVVPIGDHDVVRAALAWNLAVEIARLGTPTTVISPRTGPIEGLFPTDPVPTDPDAGHGAELQLVAARDVRELLHATQKLATQSSSRAEQAGVLLVRVPPEWLQESPEATTLLRWMLLFTSADERDLVDTYTMVKRVFSINPAARIGVTVHGASSPEDAREAFERLARSSEEHLGQALTSLGALEDDLDIYRSIVARQALGDAHPGSSAARGLREVAREVLDRGRAVPGKGSA